MLELAMAAVALILPFIKKTLTPVANQIADDVAASEGAKVKALYEKIRNKLRKGTYDGALLDGVEESPDDHDRQEALAKVLAKRLETDTAFRESVTSLVESIQPRTEGASLSAQDVGMVAQRDIKIRAKDFVGRDRIDTRGRDD